ncbi:MAG: serine/threonine-protein kinase [bacterium]|nr:serine/threonine-protein kinase [bacterium]
MSGQAERKTPFDLAPDLEEPALELFGVLVDLDPEDRILELDRRAQGDPRLRAAVLALLADHGMPPAILSRVMEQSSAGEAPSIGASGLERIGPYRLVEIVGRGGMGVVYRARQDRPQRTVAVKVMSSRGTPDAARRFEREVEVLGLLQHPGICRIYGAGTVDLGPGFGETPYFAMEYVHGPELIDFAREQELDVAARCELLARVCDAVQHAHERGIVHRDLKPGNVLVVDGEDGTPAPRVLDFGIARALQHDDAAPTINTRTGVLLGTLHYMSPEQLNGSARRVDTRSDIYSLGVMLYQLLVDRPPLALDDLPLAEVCRVVAQREPSPVGRIDRALRGDLSTIVSEALQKDPNDRYQSAADLAADLRRFVARKPISARRQTATYQLRKFAQRNQALVGSIAAMIVVLVVGLLTFAALAARNESLAAKERELSQDLRAELYRTQMRLGTAAMERPGGVARVREIIANWQTPDVPAQKDLRGFEWHLLCASAHRELAVLESGQAAENLQWTKDARRILAVQNPRAVSFDSTTAEREVIATSDLAGVAPTSFSSDGGFMAQAISSNRVRVERLPERTPVATLDFPGTLHGCWLSREAELLACRVVDVGIVVCEVASGRKLTTMARAMTGGCSFSPDGRWFLVGGAPDRAHATIWHTGEWSKPWLELENYPEYVEHVAFSACSERIATATHEQHVRIFRLPGGALERQLAHPDGLRALAFDHAGERLAVACRDFAVYLYQLDSGTNRVLQGHTGVVGGIAWSPGDDRLATISDDGTLRIWDPDQLPIRRTLEAPQRHALSRGQLTFSGDPQRLGVLYGDAASREWSLDSPDTAAHFQLESGERRYRWERSRRTVSRLSPTGQTLHSLTLPDSLRYLAIDPVTKQLAATAGRHRPIWFWDGDGSPPRKQPHDGDVWGLGWTASGKLVLLDLGGRVSVLDGITGELLDRREIAGATGMAIGPTGERLAFGCVDQIVRIVDLSRAGYENELRGHTAHVEAVAYSPDGSRLASGARDGRILLWDPDAAAEVGSLSLDARPVALAWSPDRSRLAALDSRGTTTVWDARPVEER